MHSVVVRDPLPTGAIRPLKRAEYERLAADGAFTHEKVELLFGRIAHMSPQGFGHSFGITRLTRLLVSALVDRACVRVQMPFVADESMPEPDLAIVPAGDYLDAHPDRAHLVIEVADSSLAIDRAKAALYAAAGVTEYWIVDVRAGAIEVHAHPGGDRYGRTTRHERGAVLQVPCFPDVSVSVSDVLPPRQSEAR